MSKQYSEFQTCIVVMNPASSSRHRSSTFIKQLKAIFPDKSFHIVETNDQAYKHPAALAKDISKFVKGNSLLCIAGGDGTVSLAVNLLLSSAYLKKKIKDITLLPLWGGNANDLAHMANGSSRKVNMAKLLENGISTKIYPLQVEITHRNNPKVHYAACYTSFGTSAHTIQRMNKPSYRSKRLYRLGVTRLGVELASVTKALLKAKPFKGQLQGRQRRMYDLILINGSRMAKVTRGPGKLTEPAFYELRIQRKHPVILMYAGLLVGNRSFMKRKNTSVEIEVQDGTWAQMDGETLWVPPKSQIKVLPSKSSFNLLSTKLKN